MTGEVEELEQPTENTEQTEQSAEKEVETPAEETEAGEESAGETAQDADSDEGDDVVAEDEGGAEEEPPAKPISKAQARIQKLAAERDTERQEKERLIHERALAHAQLEQLRQQQRELQTAAEKRAEDERLALLDPSERAVYQANQQIRNLEWRLNQMEIQRRNDQDRANFHAKATHDETYAKYADQVERMYQEGAERGVFASREDLHSYILGQELKKDLAAKVSKKKQVASKRIDSVTSKPASARSDVKESKKGKSLEDRLRGVLI